MKAKAYLIAAIAALAIGATTAAVMPADAAGVVVKIGTGGHHHRVHYCRTWGYHPHHARYCRIWGWR
jgi:hypothetical protein